MDETEKLQKRSSRLSTAIDVLIFAVIILSSISLGFALGALFQDARGKASHAYLIDANGDGAKDIVIVHNGGGKTVLFGDKEGKKYLRMDDVTRKVMERFK